MTRLMTLPVALLAVVAGSAAAAEQEKVDGMGRTPGWVVATDGGDLAFVDCQGRRYPLGSARIESSTKRCPTSPPPLDITGVVRSVDRTPYHGTYRSCNYSPLTEINTDNVKRLRVAWVHHPGRSTRGLQSTPLVADGVLYYTGSYSRVWALDAATGKPLWSYFPKLN